MSFDRNTPIVFLGMGLMGTRMAARLIHAGFRVAVWNRTTAVTRAFAAGAGVLADTPCCSARPKPSLG